MHNVPAPATGTDATVLICTYNRATLLDEALASLAAMRTTGSVRWEVLVVDNNSTDGTRAAVAARMAGYPVPLRYVFEAHQGRSAALNAGIAHSTSPILVVGDDDQRFADEWVDRACAPLRDGSGVDYTGGPVEPLWVAPPPRWLELRHAELMGPLGMFDYGRERFIFEDRSRPAPGGNIAMRRDLIERIGGFNTALGRTAGSLLGQEQVEFLVRSRAAGARGLYVPDMVVYHHVPLERLTRRYFRRWWYWRGVSRARMDVIHPTTDEGLDLSQVPAIAGVPRFMFRTALADAAGWVQGVFAGGASDAFVCELRLLYFAGYARERQRVEQPATASAAAR